MTATGQPDSAIQKGFGDLTPGFTYAEFNNLQAFKDAYVPGKTCAIMFEPVQGEGGVWPADEDFIKGIRAFCDEKGILMLLDGVTSIGGTVGAGAESGSNSVGAGDAADGHAAAIALAMDTTSGLMP